MKRQFIGLALFFAFMITLVNTPAMTEAVTITVTEPDLGPGVEPKELDYQVFIGTTTPVNALNFTDVLDRWDSAFAEFTTQPVTTLTSASLTDKESLVIFGPAADFSDSEINAAQTFAKRGRGILYLTSPNNISETAQDFVNRFFDAQLITFETSQLNGSTFSGEVDYVVSTDFSSPRTPAVTNLTKVVFPRGVAMDINHTARSETNQTIKDIYPIMYDPQTGKSLAIAVELESYGRIVFLGSVDIFSNEYLGTDAANQVIGSTNGLFAENLIRWLGRGSGFFNKLSHSVNATNMMHVARGDSIAASVDVRDGYNKTVVSVEVELVVETAKNDFVSQYMKTNAQTGLYEGIVSTAQAPDSIWTDIQVKLSARGYVDQRFTLARVFIQPEPNNQALPNFIVLIVGLGGVLVFSLTFALGYNEMRKLDS